MKRILYDFPFFFVFLSLVAFALYKTDNRIFWIFLALSLASLLSLRVFIASIVFVLALNGFHSSFKPITKPTQGIFKGVVYDVRKNKLTSFYIKTKKTKILLFASNVYDNIKPYDSIVFKAKLTSAIKNRSFAKYLHSCGIYLIGYASYIKKTKRNGIMSEIESLRLKLESEFYYFLHKQEYIFLQNAIFGDSTNKAAIKQAFINTQTAHIMSVSGLHMGFVFGLFYVLFYTVFANIKLFYRRFNLKTSASVAAFFPMFAYFLISGLHIPAIRSFLMVFVFILSLIYGHTKNSYNILFFIASIVVLIFGYSIVFNPSFVMSFFMSFVAIYLYKIVKGTVNSNMVSYIVFSLLIGLFAMPISAYYFHKVAYLSFLSNFIVVPYFGFILMPFSFIAITVSFLPIFFIKHIVFSVLNFATFILLKVVSSFELLKPLSITPHLLWVIITYALMFYLCERFKAYQRAISTSSR